jgi:hypothetical protein
MDLGPYNGPKTGSFKGNELFVLVEGDGWAELKDDGSLDGEICLLNGNNIPLSARRSKTSSTAC